MSKIITISGLRGGSGKSVTALNLAVALSLYERNVLLVDCDPQGSATEWSGIDGTGYPFGLADVLNGKATLIEAISKTEFNHLDMLPAGFDLFPVALKLSRLVANEKLLRLLMEEIRSDYDFILLDAPSSFGYLSIAAMTAADWLLAPFCPRMNVASDFRGLLKSIQYIRKTHETSLKIAGMMFNRCRGADEIEQFLTDQDLMEAKDLVYASFIPEDRAVPEAVEQKTPLALHDIKSPACQGYLRFARELIEAFS